MLVGKVSKNDKLMMQEKGGRLLSVIILVESKWELAHSLLGGWLNFGV